MQVLYILPYTLGLHCAEFLDMYDCFEMMLQQSFPKSCISSTFSFRRSLLLRDAQECQFNLLEREEDELEMWKTTIDLFDYFISRNKTELR